MRLALLTVAALPLALPFGCLSGQTGAPQCRGPESCVCGHEDHAQAYGGTGPTPAKYGSEALLRVLVEEATEEDLVGTVEEVVLANSEILGVGTIAAGDRIGGFLPWPQPCAHLPQRAPELGSPVLVAYTPSYTSDLTAEGRAAALLTGRLRYAVPWQDPLDFGEGRRVALSDLQVLKSHDACLARFPILRHDCDDTPSSCSVGYFGRSQP